jgi:hypothetical protein
VRQHAPDVGLVGAAAHLAVQERLEIVLDLHRRQRRQWVVADVLGIVLSLQRQRRGKQQGQKRKNDP